MWNGVVTNAGLALLERWSEGSQTLNIEKATIGTGTVPQANLRVSTTVVGEVGPVSIVSSASVTNGTSYRVQVGPSSTVPYIGHQIGIWASLEGVGVTTLLAIYQDEEGVSIPLESDEPGFLFTLYAIVTMSNDGSINVNYDGGAYVSRTDFADTMTVVNTNITTLQNKFPVSIANGGTGATTAPNACANLGAVKKSGDVMTGPLTVNVGSGTTALDIKASETAYRGVSFRYRLAEALGIARAIFYQFKSNNTNYDLFKLPATTVSDTSNGEYDILTTKDTVTVSQGGTGAATPAGACENLGAVKKSGDTMTGGLTAPKFTNSDVDYVVQRAGSSFRQGILRMLNASTTHKWQLFQMKANNTNFDSFSLPATTDSDTTNQSYDILTTKTTNVAVSAANGATVGNPSTCRKVGNLLYINLRITVPSSFTGAEVQCTTFSSGLSSAVNVYDRVLGPAGEVVGVHITPSGIGLLGASSALAGKQVLINTLIMDA